MTDTDRRIVRYLQMSSDAGYYDAQIVNERSFAVWRELSVLRTGLLNWYPVPEWITRTEKER